MEKKEFFDSFMVDDGVDDTKKGMRYAALLYSIGVMAMSQSWKPIVGGILLHAVLWAGMDGKIAGPSNVYSFIDGVLLAKGDYLLAAPVALLNVVEAVDLDQNTNMAHAGDTALGFLLEKMGVV